MDHANRSGSASGRSSGVASPSTERNQPERSNEPSTPRVGEGLSESFQSTETVRRRPEGVLYGEILIRQRYTTWIAH